MILSHHVKYIKTCIHTHSFCMIAHRVHMAGAGKWTVCRAWYPPVVQSRPTRLPMTATVVFEYLMTASKLPDIPLQMYYGMQRQVGALYNPNSPWAASSCNGEACVPACQQMRRTHLARVARIQCIVSVAHSHDGAGPTSCHCRSTRQATGLAGKTGLPVLL